MTTFQDGPAGGKTLSLHRAPFFLRVVVGPILDDTDVDNAKIDALDQPEDEPTRHEKIYAYRLTARPISCHIRASGGRGGFFAIGNYRMVPEQPSEDVMRDRRSWVAWCEANKAMADDLK